MGNPIGFCINQEEKVEKTQVAETKEVKEDEYRHTLVDTQNEAVNHPSHYTYGTIETIDMIESCGWLPHFCAGNALKYLTRHEHKGKKIEDLEKAGWYITKLIEYYTKETKKEKTLEQAQEPSEEIESTKSPIGFVTPEPAEDNLEQIETYAEIYDKFKQFFDLSFNDFYPVTISKTYCSPRGINRVAESSTIQIDHDQDCRARLKHLKNLFYYLTEEPDHDINWDKCFIRMSQAPDCEMQIHIHISYGAGPLIGFYTNKEINIISGDRTIIHPELIKETNTFEKETK